MPDGLAFCTNCGAPLQQPVYQQPYGEPAPAEKGGTAPLVLGIIALVICLLCGGLTLVSLILAIIAIAQAGKYAKTHAVVPGKVKAGKILGIIALILSILTIVVNIVLSVLGFVFYGAQIATMLASGGGIEGFMDMFEDIMSGMAIML